MTNNCQNLEFCRISFVKRDFLSDFQTQWITAQHNYEEYWGYEGPNLGQNSQNWQEVAKILRRWFGKVAIIEWLLRWEDSKFNGTRGICYCVCWWTLSFTVSKKAVKRWEYGWAATYTTYKCKQSKPLLWVVKRRILPLREDQQLKIITRCQPVSTAFSMIKTQRVICQEKWPLNRSIQSHSQSIGQLKASTSTTDNNQLLILKSWPTTLKGVFATFSTFNCFML